MPELYSIKELLDGILPLHFKTIDRYHQEDPLLTENTTEQNITRVIFEEAGIP